MKRFVIDEGFFGIFPDAVIGTLACRGIDNTSRKPEYFEGLLREAEKAAMRHLPNDEFSENTAVSVWRSAYRLFNGKKGARCSVEALLKRVRNGNLIGSINPLVDIYNAVSLSSGLPCGGEDIDTFEGDLRLTQALGNEAFSVMGSEELDPPKEGEIVYKDDAGIVCRNWNWREAARTALAERTANAFLCLESVDGSRRGELESALAELARLVSDNLGGTVTARILDSGCRETNISG